MAPVFRGFFLSAMLVVCGAGAAQAVDATYTYDTLGRLTAVTYSCGASTSYVYDAAGNRTTSGATAASGCPPVAGPDTESTPANTPVTFDPRTNDTDPNGFALTVTATGAAAHGTVVINGSATLTYTPTTGYSGADSFTYTISNGHSGTATGNVSVTVTAANGPPIAGPVATSTTQNTADTFDPRSAASDPDGDPLTIASVGTPGHGTAVVNSGISVTYTPATGYSGADSFTYTVSDGHAHTATGNVSVTVNPAANGPPTCVSGSQPINMFTTPGHPVLPTTTFDPRRFCSDPDGDSMTITLVGTPGHGTAVINGGTSVTYTYSRSVVVLNQSDSFTFTVSDGHSHTVSATATINIDVEDGQ